MKRLYRTRTGKLCGVCEGLGEYFNVDPTVVRVGFLIVGCLGAGVLAYFVAAIIIPYKDQVV